MGLTLSPAESFTAASISSIRNHFEYCQGYLPGYCETGTKGEQVIKLNAWIGCVSFLWIQRCMVRQREVSNYI